MKISIIGAGSVGSLTAMRLVQENLAEIVLVDIAKGIALGKALDLEDARNILKIDYGISGSENIAEINGSDIVVITAGLARRPGMTREELLSKNAGILKELSQGITKLAPDAIVVIVTNPLDLMTRLVLKVTGFASERLIGMGISLDAGRFANLIAQKLDLSVTDIDALVIGGHGEGMLPLPRLSTVKGVSLNEVLGIEAARELAQATFNRGAQIVSLLGSGSAFFAPSAAIAAIVRAIINDEKRVIGACACLNGEYGLKDVCIGVPCRIGRRGIEEIVELDLNKEEKEAFLRSAAKLKSQYSSI